MDRRQASRPLGVAAVTGILLSTAGCGASNHAASGDATTRHPVTAKAAAVFAPGDYRATGNYVDPGGSDSILVDATLTSAGVISKLKVTPLADADDVECKKFQDQFAAGIDAVVKGRNISGLKVDKVSGSSLTGKGFNAAIAQIAARAKAARTVS